jgi:hypothetical protein
MTNKINRLAMKLIIDIVIAQYQDLQIKKAAGK